MPFAPKRYFLSVLLLSSCFSFSQLKGQSFCDENRQGQVVVSPKSKVELDAICECKSISNLWIKKMLVINLPACFLDLEALTALSFSKSEMSRVPDEVLQMKNLASLDFSYTPIYVLPQEIAGMSNLVSLDLKHTFVETLPEGLEHIQTIDMRYVEMSIETQRALKAQYPNIVFYFSSPCNCK
jgi:Leucine-rich repeat (LRR) protein